MQVQVKDCLKLLPDLTGDLLEVKWKKPQPTNTKPKNHWLFTMGKSCSAVLPFQWDSSTAGQVQGEHQVLLWDNPLRHLRHWVFCNRLMVYFCPSWKAKRFLSKLRVDGGRGIWCQWKSPFSLCRHVSMVVKLPRLRLLQRPAQHFCMAASK